MRDDNLIEHLNKHGVRFWTTEQLAVASHDATLRSAVSFGCSPADQ